MATNRWAKRRNVGITSVAGGTALLSDLNRFIEANGTDDIPSLIGDLDSITAGEVTIGNVVCRESPSFLHSPR